MGQTQQQELALASVEGGHGGPDCSQHLVFFFFPHRDTDIYDDVEIYGRFKWTVASL